MTQPALHLGRRGKETLDGLHAQGYVLGIDVSGHQGDDIDWHAVAACGVKFVIVKVSEGSDDTYRTARAHVLGALAAGLEVATYHFQTAYYRPKPGDPILEALAYVKAMSRLPIDQLLFCADDLEKWGRIEESKLGPEALTIYLHAFQGIVHAMTYMEPAMYVSAKAFSEKGSGRVLDANMLNIYNLWVADYTRPIGEPILPGDWKTWVIHQYSSDGKVPGIQDGARDVDMNVMRRDDFRRLQMARSVRPLTRTFDLSRVDA